MGGGGSLNLVSLVFEGGGGGGLGVGGVRAGSFPPSPESATA